MTTKIETDQRVCANPKCRKLFDAPVRSYKRYCDQCFKQICTEAGKRGGRPKKAKD